MRASHIEATLLIAASVVAAATGLCQPGRTYWSPEKDTCLECTRCEPLVVLRPCEIYRDTSCAPLKDLHLDWSWLSPQRKPKTHKKIIWKFHSISDEIASSSSTTSTTPVSIEYESYDDDIEVRIDNSDVAIDWQTVVLTMAGSAGVLFFVVVALGSCYYARQWRKLKEKMETDVEGLTVKLALMMSQVSENLPETTASPTTPFSDNVRCAYLEQLLAGKNKDLGSGAGNVYIQENNNNNY